MLKERARLVAIGLLVADLAAVALAFLAAYWLRDSVLPWIGIRPQVLYPLRLYMPLLPIALTLWGLILWGSGAYRSHRTMSLLEEAWAIVRTSALGTLFFVLVVYSLRLDETLLDGDKLSRLWIFLFAALSTLSLLAHRTLVRLLSRYVRSRGLNYRNVVVAGTGPSARDVQRAIERHRHWGYRVVGFVHLSDGTDTEFAGRPVLGTLDELPALLRHHVVDEVLVVVSRAELQSIEGPLLALEEQGVVVRLALDLFPHAKARMTVSDLDGIPVLTFSTTPSSLLLLAVKRCMDLAISAVLLACALPVMGAIALAIKASSRGGVLFRQTRCGLNGRRFTMYKFRTMIEDAEDRRPGLEHLNEMSGPVFKARRDPRVTGLGRLLRRYSLDELPQLWNVVSGNMSLVGPRPPIPEEVDLYESWQRRRLSMRPGLTCLWQISGRNQVDFHRWMELDLQYIDTWSPALDMKILLKTVPVVLSGRGAS